MARARNRREFQAVVMECPLYFSAPLLGRLGSLNFFSQRSVYYRICAYNQQVIGGGCYLKIGEFDKSMNNLSS